MSDAITTRRVGGSGFSTFLVLCMLWFVISLLFCPSIRPRESVTLTNKLRTNLMQKYTKALDYREAYKLMEARDELGKPKSFDVEFIPVGGGRKQTAYGVICTSVSKAKGMRRIYYPESGQYRWIYDVLITQINDTRILVR